MERSRDSRGRSGGFRSGGRSSGGRSFGGGGRSFGGGRSGGGFGRSRPEMHDAICSKCNSQCQVPFRPTGEKPVLCSDCFRNANSGGNFARPQQSFQQPSSPASSEQLSRIESKLDKILKALEVEEEQPSSE